MCGGQTWRARFGRFIVVGMRYAARAMALREGHIQVTEKRALTSSITNVSIQDLTLFTHQEKRK